MAKLSFKTPLDGPVAEICLKHGNKPDGLLEILHDTQEKFGHVPETALPIIANILNLSRAEVYGVATFYHDFHLEPQKKHVIKLCAAEACQSMGSRELGALIEKLAAGKSITVEKTYCLGLCASSPALMVNGKVSARVTPAKAKALIKELA